MRFLISFLLWAIPTLAYTEALNLVWDKVLFDTEGKPITGVKYKLYRSANGGSYKLVATREGNSFTWYFPILGHYIYRVTAINSAGESLPSNALRIWIEPIPKLSSVQPQAINEIGITIDSRPREE